MRAAARAVGDLDAQELREPHLHGDPRAIVQHEEEPASAEHRLVDLVEADLRPSTHRAPGAARGEVEVAAAGDRPVARGGTPLEPDAPPDRQDALAGRQERRDRRDPAPAAVIRSDWYRRRASAAAASSARASARAPGPSPRDGRGDRFVHGVGPGRPARREAWSGDGTPPWRGNLARIAPAFPPWSYRRGYGLSGTYAWPRASSLALRAPDTHPTIRGYSRSAVRHRRYCRGDSRSDTRPATRCASRALAARPIVPPWRHGLPDALIRPMRVRARVPYVPCPPIPSQGGAPVSGRRQPGPRREGASMRRKFVVFLAVFALCAGVAGTAIAQQGPGAPAAAAPVAGALAPADGGTGAATPASAPTNPKDESKVPHYFGPYPNWVNSPQVLANAVVTIAAPPAGVTGRGDGDGRPEDRRHHRLHGHEPGQRLQPHRRPGRDHHEPGRDARRRWPARPRSSRRVS